MTILLWISALSFLAMALLVGMRVVAIRRGETVELTAPSFHDVVQPKIDFIAFFFVVLCRDISKYLSLHALLFIKKMISKLKVAIIKFEKRFGKVIDMVHGKGQVPAEKGSVSSYLSQIKPEKEE